MFCYLSSTHQPTSNHEIKTMTGHHEPPFFLIIINHQLKFLFQRLSFRAASKGKNSNAKPLKLGLIRNMFKAMSRSQNGPPVPGSPLVGQHGIALLFQPSFPGRKCRMRRHGIWILRFCKNCPLPWTIWQVTQWHTKKFFLKKKHVQWA